MHMAEFARRTNQRACTSCKCAAQDFGICPSLYTFRTLYKTAILNQRRIQGRYHRICDKCISAMPKYTAYYGYCMDGKYAAIKAAV